MTVRKKNILFGGAALILGVALYILFRGGSYVGQLFSGSVCIQMLRNWVRPLNCDLLRFYLPDLLWGLSLSCGLLAIQGEGRSGIFICAGISFFCGCGWEVLQLADAVSGTGDGMDVLMYLLGSVICVQFNVKEKSMKKINALLMALLIAVFAVFALGSTEDTGTQDQGKGSVGQNQGNGSASQNQGNGSANNDEIGEYSVVIDSCRLAKDYEGDAVVIVKYVFKNVGDDDASSFYLTFDDTVYQDGVGLNEAFILDDSANYSTDNQRKEIKKGASIEVEVAYELNDTTTDIEVEVKELFSFDDTTITKTFSIA